MSRDQLRLLIVISLVWIPSACTNGQSLPVKAASLQENLSLLEEVALEWREDAYLFGADVQLISGNSQRPAIFAGFQSPSEDAESLLVMIEQDGSILTERIPHEVPVRQFEPITDKDWKLDTAEALEKALSDEGRDYLKNNVESQCSGLALHRNTQRPGEPVEWSLSLGGCLLEGLFQRTTIDPITGEVLSRQSFP